MKKAAANAAAQIIRFRPALQDQLEQEDQQLNEQRQSGERDNGCDPGAAKAHTEADDDPAASTNHQRHEPVHTH